MRLLPLIYLLSSLVETASSQEIRPGVVTVSEGAHALLPCAVASGQSIDKFDWRKDNGENEKKEVFFYDRGSHYSNGFQGQNEQFKDRVVFFQDQLKFGNASIMIKNTRLKDNGTYTCVLFEPKKQEVSITLNVGAAHVPYIKTIRDEISWRVLECKVQGIPKPQVVWRNSAGEVLPVKETSHPQNPNGLFSVELQVNVTKSDIYTCVATQWDIFHQINNTSEVSVPDSVAVSEGDDVILPCSLNSKHNIKNMMFTWKKNNEEVFFYNSGREKEHKEMNGRLMLFQHEMETGNASIKIHNTQKSDSGHYSCHVPNIHKSHVVLQVVGKNGSFENSPGLIITIILLASSLLMIGVVVLVLCVKGRLVLRPSVKGPREEYQHANDATS